MLVTSPLAAASSASAGDDFSFYEQSARAAALGGAFTARSDDVSTLFYNPAGLAFLGGIRLKTNVVFGRRIVTAAWPGDDSVFRTREIDLVSSYAVSWQPVKRVTLAAGSAMPYGYQSLWTAGWSGRTLCSQSHFKAHYVSLTAAIEIFKGFAVGGGLDLVSSSLEWQHYILYGDLSILSAQELSGKGRGFTAGAMWKIVPAVQIGARYRESVAVDYEGHNIFSSVGGILPQDVTAHLTLPREIACGVLLTPVPRVSLSLDLQWNTWSEFGDWTVTAVDEDFHDILPEFALQSVALGLSDTTTIKAGFEYRVARHTALRAGYSHHPSSVSDDDRSPVYPDLDRSIFSLGFGYEGPLFSVWGDGERVSDLSFDLYLRYAAAGAGPSALPGYEMTYDSGRLVIGVGAGFAF
jgi:long-chain fatty acid transport protein